LGKLKKKKDFKEHVGMNLKKGFPLKGMEEIPGLCLLKVMAKPWN